MSTLDINLVRFCVVCDLFVSTLNMEIFVCDHLPTYNTSTFFPLRKFVICVAIIFIFM